MRSQDHDPAAGDAREDGAPRHTPGPWEVRGGPTLLVVCSPLEDIRVASTSWHTRTRSPWPLCPEAVANAYLIAAAPELLEALEVMVEAECDYMRLNNLGDPEKQHNVRLARAAIAKALPKASGNPQ